MRKRRPTRPGAASARRGSAGTKGRHGARDSTGRARGTSDEAAIRKLVEDWARAVRRRDFDGILRHHSPSILMFDVPPPLQSKGLAAYRKTWDLFFSWARDPAVFDIVEMRVTAGADVGFVTAQMRCAGTEASGADIELDFRLTQDRQPVDGDARAPLDPGRAVAARPGAVD
jgi:ketosteroid isomerase-like protein